MIKQKTIQDYVREHANAEQGFDIWLEMIKAADWYEPKDITKSIPTADILIGGNKFRCICTYSFGRSHVHLFMKWIGTHAEYSKLLKSDLQYTISKY